MTTDEQIADLTARLRECMDNLRIAERTLTEALECMGHMRVAEHAMHAMTQVQSDIEQLKLNAMTFERFSNALRVMIGLDLWELQEQHIFIGDTEIADWEKFRDDPWRFFICTNKATAEGIWRAMQKRMERRRPRLALVSNDDPKGAA